MNASELKQNRHSKDKVRVLYDILIRLKKATFSQLKELTHMEDVDLCFALCSLIMGKKIFQKKEHNHVVYEIM